MTAHTARARLDAVLTTDRRTPLDRAHAFPILTRPDTMIDTDKLDELADQIAERTRAKLLPVIDERVRSANAEAGRFDRRVEALSPWQTVAAAIALLVIGALIGAGVASASETALSDYGCPTGWIDAATGEPFDVQAFLATDPRPDVVLECPEAAAGQVDDAGDDV